MIRIQVPTSTSRETYLMGIPRPGHARRDPTILNADPISALPKRLAVASASHSPTNVSLASGKWVPCCSVEPNRKHDGVESTLNGGLHVRPGQFFESERLRS